MTKLTMPSYSSISLANTKVKFTLFTFSFALALVLYWPGMNGSPIWDDMTYWFYDPVMNPTFPYSEIWKTFTWPLSVTAQKFFYSLGGKNWWVYHSLNFLLHSFNSWLVYRFLLQLRMRRSFAFIGFVLFLIHPASVITVAWMIQFKTLICFSLAMGAILLFMKARGKKEYILSTFLFLLSVLSKSSSLPLPVVLIFLLGQKWKTKKILTVIPYFLISAFGAYQITHSKLAVEAIENAAVTTEKGATTVETSVVTESIPEPVATIETKKGFTAESILADPDFLDQQFTPPPDEPMVKTEVEFAPEGVEYKEQTEHKSIVEPTESLEELSPSVAYGRLIVKTLYYYFWQSFLPVDNSPVKGLNPYPPQFQDYLHLLFLVILGFICWATFMFPILLSAHVFLLPYLGLIPAPYMNVTWVSDQHLYLVLPCFILLLLGLIDKVKHRAAVVPLVLLCVFFAYKTRETSRFYENNLTFHEKSINHNINNIPLIYNLAMAYVGADQQVKAIDLLETAINAAKTNPHMQDNRFYPFLINLYTRLTIPAVIE
ncbi:MAG: hypothetical protein V4598_08500 [Bdellovibrionota bacterium]